MARRIRRRINRNILVMPSRVYTTDLSHPYLPIACIIAPYRCADGDIPGLKRGHVIPTGNRDALDCPCQSWHLSIEPVSAAVIGSIYFRPAIGNNGNNLRGIGLDSDIGGVTRIQHRTGSDESAGDLLP